MFFNYVKIAIRNLSKHKGYALTNVFGLAMGLAVTLMILLYIQFQLSYDSFHKKSDRLYRVSVVYSKEGNRISDSPEFVAPLAPAMADELPEIENAARISEDRTAYVSFQNRTIKLDKILHVDSSFFDLFSFEMVAGNQNTGLVQPFSIILTEETARQLFGADNPVGKSVKIDNSDSYLVTGVVKQPPENSHIQFQALISFSTLYHIPNMFMDWNGGWQYIAYILLHSGASPDLVQSKLPAFMWKHLNQQYASMNLNYAPYLQPFGDIHLYYSDDSKSLRTSLYAFAAIAVLILFIACANFVNLAIARAIPRAKEVGVRKVLGASRSNLIRQFLGESLLLTCTAVVVALFFVEMISTQTYQLLGMQTSISALATPATGLVFFGIVVVVGIASGSYPSFYLASMEAIETLKGRARARKGKLRDALVVLQFAISIVLIICTAVVVRQMHFLKQKDLGFTKDNMLVLSLIGEEARSKVDILKSEFLRIPGVVGATASSDVPHAGFTSNGYFPEGFSSPMMIHVVDVDDQFLSTFGIELVKGRNFLPASPSDNRAFLINEKLAQTLGWTEPLGKTIKRNGDHPIIGVVKDFHFATLHDQIEPLIITNRPWDKFSHLTLKLRTTDLQSTMGRIQHTWNDITSSTPFVFSFLDQSVDRMYRSEQRMQRLFEWFSVTAILIALVGLISLVSLSIEQRTKEIGVRKVLGASVANITSLLTNRIAILVVAANIISWPIAYFVATQWLDDFAYKIELDLSLFLSAAIGTLMIALAAVGVHTIRAALTNPVNALRYE